MWEGGRKARPGPRSPQTPGSQLGGLTVGGVQSPQLFLGLGGRESPTVLWNSRTEAAERRASGTSLPPPHNFSGRETEAQLERELLGQYTESQNQARIDSLVCRAHRLGAHETQGPETLIQGRGCQASRPFHRLQDGGLTTWQGCLFSSQRTTPRG